MHDKQTQGLVKQRWRRGAITLMAPPGGMAVKEYLASRDLPSDGLFLGAAKAVPPEAKWSPRAELNIAIP